MKVLECIFGEIESGSEYRRRLRVSYEALEEDRYRMDARMTVSQFNELLGCSIDDERFETIGGVLLSEFGQLPEEGTAIQIEGLKFTIVSVSGQRIANIIVDTSDTVGS